MNCCSLDQDRCWALGHARQTGFYGAGGGWGPSCHRGHAEEEQAKRVSDTPHLLHDKRNLKGDAQASREHEVRKPAADLRSQGRGDDADWGKE